MKKIFLFFIFVKLLVGANLEFDINITSDITDIKLIDKLLYICTDASEVDIFDIDTKKFKTPLKFDKVKIYFGKDIDAKIFSFDKIGDEEIVLTQGDYGKKNLYFLNKSGRKKIVLSNQSIIKANFIDKDRLVLASLDSEIFIFNLIEEKIEFHHKFSTSVLSDLEIEDNLLYLACESGKIFVFNLGDKKLQNTINAHNDNIYKIAVKNKKIISGSNDRFVGIWDYFAKSKNDLISLSDGVRKEMPFFVYCVGISDKYYAYTSDENGDVVILDKNLQEVDKIDTNQGLITNIVFINDKEVITSSNSKTLKFWSIK